MFEQSVVETRGVAARPWTLAVSLAGQVALVGAAVVFPLIHPEVLQRVSVLIPISAPHAYHPPKPQKVDATRVLTARRVFRAATLFAPPRVPEKIPMLQDDPAPEIAGPATDGVPGALDSPGQTSSIIAVISKSPPEVQPPAVVKTAPRPAETIVPRIKQGGTVQAALLVYGPKPGYPVLARQARISGSVHLAAVIGTDGHILDLRATAGHPLLVGSAIEAVKHWVYRPTLLNGDPVEVVTEITVTFTLQ